MHRRRRLIRLDSMKIRQFIEEDIFYINLWLAQRERAPVKRNELPECGWTVTDESNNPVGCVFLRLMEGDLAMIDSLINDPTQSSHRRHVINDRLFIQCLKMAKENNLKGLIGMSLDEGTLKRAINHGFELSKMMSAVWNNKEVK